MTGVNLSQEQISQIASQAAISAVQAVMGVSANLVQKPVLEQQKPKYQVKNGESRNLTKKELAALDMLKEGDAFCDRMNAKPLNPKSTHSQTDWAVKKISDKSVRIGYVNTNLSTGFSEVKTRMYTPFVGSNGCLAWKGWRTSDKILHTFTKKLD